MAELATLARPYANAVFDIASEREALDRWSRMLTVASAAVAEPTVQAMIESPAVTDEQKAHGLIDVVRDELDDAGRRFLHTLAANKRLTLLPEIGTQFEALKAEAERVLDVEIASAVKLSSNELDRFTDALKRRYERDIQLSTVVDEDLIGGAVVRAGDTVVDGSVRGKLDKLAESLTGAISPGSARG